MEVPKGHCMKALGCWRSRTTGRPEEGSRHGVELGQERVCVLRVHSWNGRTGQAVWIPEDAVSSSTCQRQSFRIWCFSCWASVLFQYDLSLSCHILLFWNVSLYVRSVTHFYVTRAMVQRLSIRRDASLTLLQSVKTIKDF